MLPATRSRVRIRSAQGRMVSTSQPIDPNAMAMATMADLSSVDVDTDHNSRTAAAYLATSVGTRSVWRRSCAPVPQTHGSDVGIATSFALEFAATDQIEVASSTAPWSQTPSSTSRWLTAHLLFVLGRLVIMTLIGMAHRSLG